MKIIRRQFIKEVRSDGIDWINLNPDNFKGYVNMMNLGVHTRIWWFLSSQTTVTYYWRACRLSKSGISRSEKYSGPVKDRRELWALTYVYGSYIDQRITTVCCGLCAIDRLVDGGRFVAEAHGGPGVTNAFCICVCLSSSLPYCFPSGFVSRVLSHCSDDRRIGVRLPVRVGGGFSLSLCRDPPSMGSAPSRGHFRRCKAEGSAVTYSVPSTFEESERVEPSLRLPVRHSCQP